MTPSVGEIVEHGSSHILCSHLPRRKGLGTGSHLCGFIQVSGRTKEGVGAEREAGRGCPSARCHSFTTWCLVVSQGFSVPSHPYPVVMRGSAVFSSNNFNGLLYIRLLFLCHQELALVSGRDVICLFQHRRTCPRPCWLCLSPSVTDPAPKLIWGLVSYRSGSKSTMCVYNPLQRSFETWWYDLL